MKSSTVWKSVFLFLAIALIASLTANGYLWQQLTSLTTVPVSSLSGSPGPDVTPSGSGERVSLLDRYNEIRQQVNRRLGRGTDAQTFITPDAPAVVARVKEIVISDYTKTDEYWRNCDNLYRWVTQNIDYTPDSYSPYFPESINGEIKWYADSWRMPEETLHDEAGDCEDISNLLVSMILNFNKHTYGAWVVEVRNSNSAHVGVVLPVQTGMLVVMDPSVKYNTSPDEGAVLNAKDATTAINLWLQKLQDKVPGGEVRSAFSDNFYQEFSGTEEFLNWVKASVK